MIDYFGFLDMNYSVSFGNVKIAPVEKFDDVKAWIKKYTNNDGFVYPQTINRIELDVKTLKEKRVIPNVEFLYKMPPSHSINIQYPFYKVDLRKWDFAFLINLLGFLHGTRLQFYNWWFDGKVPIRNMDNIYISPKEITKFLSTAYEAWKKWNEINKERIINLLVMHTRIPTYEWEFERFFLNYTVFDGAFKIAEKIYKCKATSHIKQFRSVIKRFGLASNDEHINKIYNLRNDLFHHAIWDGGYPNSPTDKYEGWIQEIVLRKFNIRFLVALLNYKTDFIKTPWWTIDTFPIDSSRYK